MIHSRFAPSTFARAIAVIAFALALNARAAETASNPLSNLSSARESAAPAVTLAPAAPLTPTVGTPAPETSAAAAANQPFDKAAALAKAAEEEVHGLLKLGASLTDRAEPDFEAAEIAYRQVLNAPAAKTEDLKIALLGMAHMHRKHGEMTKASAVYERFLADFPGDERAPEALLELGRTLRDMGAYKLAIARFYAVMNSTLKLNGEGFGRYQILANTAAFEIADTHLAAGDFEDANKYFTNFRLLNVAPSDRARAQFKAACALRDGAKLDNAITAFRAFIEQCPDDDNIPEARYLLATTLRDVKRPQEAMAVALDLLREEKSRVATAPKRWLHWQLVTGNQLANEFYNSGSVQQAYDIYRSLLELSPDMSWRLPITYQLGLCYERLGIIDQAMKSYQSVVQLAGPNPSQQFTELAEMATWRMEHLEWREKTTADINRFFDSTSGKQASIATDGPKTGTTP